MTIEENYKIGLEKVLDTYLSDLSNDVTATTKISDFIFLNEKKQGKLTGFEIQKIISDKLTPAISKRLYEKYAKNSIKRLTVGELKNKIANLPDEMLIGGVGHFGEFEPIDISDVGVDFARPILNKSGFWRDAENYKIEILTFNMPDFGDDPE